MSKVGLLQAAAVVWAPTSPRRLWTLVTRLSLQVAIRIGWSNAGYFLSFQPVSQAYDIALRRRAEEFLVVAAEV